MADFSGRKRSQPWFSSLPAANDSYWDLVGLPGREVCFVSEAELAAYLSLAFFSKKHLNLSWLEMQFDVGRGCEVPALVCKKGVEVVYASAYGFVVRAETTNYCIGLDWVTEISIDIP